VVLADRQVAEADKVAAHLNDAGCSAAAVELDVRDVEGFRAVVAGAVSETGRLDYLFNNAGIGVAAEMSDYDAADWDDVIDVNLRGVTHGVLAGYPRMIEQGFGHIVNTASMAGLIALPFQGSYTATKHAVVGLSKALRVEARRHGVKVSVVCPGVIRTPMFDGGRYGRIKIGLDRDMVIDSLERMRPLAPEILAKRVLRGVDRNRAIIIAPAWWRLLWWLDRISPALSSGSNRWFHGKVLRDMGQRSD
jgi:NAD(P)-dependent dehydrogenase (short-subunit alcohol dehydrogenase family)